MKLLFTWSVVGFFIQRTTDEPLLLSPANHTPNYINRQMLIQQKLPKMLSTIADVASYLKHTVAPRVRTAGINHPSGVTATFAELPFTSAINPRGRTNLWDSVHVLNTAHSLHTNTSFSGINWINGNRWWGESKPGVDVEADGWTTSHLLSHFFKDI